MKPVKCDLPETIDTLYIEIFSDLHIGSKKCNYKLIQERINKVLNDENRYCIILGDLMNNSTKTSVGDVYEEELTPMAQVKHAITLFGPIKDKILLCTAGNHERRSYKTDGIDLMWMFAKELGIIDKYDYCACLGFIRFGKSTQKQNRGRKICYSMYVSHGDGIGGRTSGSKANGLERKGQIIPQADIMVVGHTHMPLGFRDSYFDIDYQNSTIHKKDRLYVNASATLEYEEYAELYGMKPSSTESPVIVLRARNKYATVVL